jgi:hypothetical protein
MEGATKHHGQLSRLPRKSDHFVPDSSHAHDLLTTLVICK